MVFCTYCGQSFTRDEHLERHILTRKSAPFFQCFAAQLRLQLFLKLITLERTDTNVKPFKCFTCHMSFARRYVFHFQLFQVYRV